MSSPEAAGWQETVLVWALRVGGVLTGLAIPTALLSAGQMAEIHEWLGLGAFPERPITLYMARSLSLLYGFHGILLLAISMDVRRYRTLVVVLAWTSLALGPALLAVDVSAGMPRYWTFSEGPGLIAMATVLLLLVRRVPKA